MRPGSAITIMHQPNMAYKVTGMKPGSKQLIVLMFYELPSIFSLIE